MARRYSRSASKDVEGAMRKRKRGTLARGKGGKGGKVKVASRRSPSVSRKRARRARKSPSVNRNARLPILRHSGSVGGQLPQVNQSQSDPNRIGDSPFAAQVASVRSYCFGGYACASDFAEDEPMSVGLRISVRAVRTPIRYYRGPALEPKFCCRLFVRALEVSWRPGCLVRPRGRRSIERSRPLSCAVSMPLWA